MNRILRPKLFNLNLGKDAVRPFIVDYPEQINAQTIIDKDMLFTMNSIVSY